MKITGSNSYIKFDLENGYVLKAEGERLTGNRFVVYTETMRKWEAPHHDESVDKNQIEQIIKEVESQITENTVQIIFE